MPLSRNYKRVLEVELLTAQIPIASYIIDCSDPYLGNQGNNTFRFGEGYIIDDGSLYGICNDRLTIRGKTQIYRSYVVINFGFGSVL